MFEVLGFFIDFILAFFSIYFLSYDHFFYFYNNSSFFLFTYFFFIILHCVYIYYNFILFLLFYFVLFDLILLYLLLFYFILRHFVFFLITLSNHSVSLCLKKKIGIFLLFPLFYFPLFIKQDSGVL